MISSPVNSRYPAISPCTNLTLSYRWMTLFVTEQTGLESCKHACYAQVITGANCLVTADGSTIAVRTIADTQPHSFIESIIYLNLEDTISQMCTFPFQGKHSILALVKDLVKAISVNDDHSHKSITIPIDVILGHLNALETGPIMMVYTAQGIDYLLLHRHSGFITIVNLSLVLPSNSNKPLQKRKTASDNTKVKTFEIGEFTIILMTLTKNKNPLLAVLYRDVDFLYSLRYYRIEMHLDNVIVEKQMEVFQGAPTHIYSVNGGVVVVSDTKVWYFAAPTKQVILESSSGDSVFPVTFNKIQNVITLNASSLSKKLLGCKMNCSTAIDDKRQLVLLDRGDALLIYLDLNSLSAVDTVAEFKIVDLLKATIASKVIHLLENVFFASSDLSRSVIFRILHKPPYIGILETLFDDLPILSILRIHHRYGAYLAIARGGFASGEVRIEPTVKSAKHVKSVSLSPEATSFEIMRNTKSVWLKLCASNSLLDDFYSMDLIKIAKPKSMSNDQPKQPMSITWRLNNNETIYVSKNLPIEIEYRSSKVVLCDFDQVSDIAWSKHERTTFFASLWNGKIIQLEFDQLGGQVVWESDLPFTGSVSLVYKKASADIHVLFALSNDGSLLQMAFKKGRYLCSTLRQPSKTGNFFRISKAEEYSSLFIYDAFEVFSLSQPENSIFFEPLSVLKSNNSIMFCDSGPDGPIVLFTGGMLSIFELASRGSSSSYLSSKLIKSLVTYLDQYILALELEERPNQSTGRVDYISRILLFDQSSLKLLDTYQADAKHSYADICVMDLKSIENQEPIIIVANSGVAAQQMLPTFRVKNGKLSKPEYYKMNGSFSKISSVVKFACHNQRLTLVGSSITEVELDEVNNARSWNGATLSRSGSIYFGVDIAHNEKCTVFADVSRGLFVSGKFGTSYNPLHLDKPPHFVTAIALFKREPILIYGDSAGNVGGVSMDLKDAKQNGGAICGQKTKQLFARNVNGAINSICIVLETPLCFFVGTSTGKLFRFVDVTLSKLALELLAREQEPTSWKTIGHANIDVSIDRSCDVYDGGSFVKLIESNDNSITDLVEMTLASYDLYRHF